MHCLHVLSLRHILLLRGDKTYRKVHSLHILSLLRQQHMICLSFPSLVLGVCVRRAHVSVCVCPRAGVCAHACVCVCVRARPCGCVPVRVCAFVRGSARAPACVLLCIVLCLLSPPQAALNWNSVLLRVDYEATAARSSVSCVKYDYRYWETEWKCGLIVCCGCVVWLNGW